MNNRQFFNALRESMPDDQALIFLIKKDFGGVSKFARRIKKTNQAIYGALKGQNSKVRSRIASELGFNPWG